MKQLNKFVHVDTGSFGRSAGKNPIVLVHEQLADTSAAAKDATDNLKSLVTLLLEYCSRWGDGERGMKVLSSQAFDESA